MLARTVNGSVRITRFSIRTPVTALSLCGKSLSVQMAAFSAASKPLGTSFNPLRPADEQDKLLFTPGPLTTSYTTKLAAVRDLGSRDAAFIKIVHEVCDGILKIAGVSKEEFATVPLQGSGTYGVEATLSCAVPRQGGKVAILANGAYGRRMAQICKVQNIPHVLIDFPEHKVFENPEAVAQEVADAKCTHLAIVHSETTSGTINDVELFARYFGARGLSVIVDAMSSFGAYPISMEHIDYLVSSSNKCVEGLPGFSYVVARKTALAKTKGNATSLVLDVFAQRDGLDKSGQFRFTPPTHALLAFRQALSELEDEGGVKARGARYRENQRTLQLAMDRLGFSLFLKPEQQGYIISSYRYPADPNWNFDAFYTKLNDRGFVIYPGKVSDADCFRIGHIGRLFPSDTTKLAQAIEEVCKELKTAAFYKA